MVCAAARQLEDGRTAVIGTGMPLAAAMLAQKTKAPHLIIMFEAGSAAPQLIRMSVSVADSYTQTCALLHSSMNEIMEACQRGMVDYTFLGGAQIDRFGNLNSTMIGLDFLTTPGYLTGPGARERAGLPPDTGPYKVISTLAFMGFDPQTKCMRVESLHPGVTREDIIANTGFEMLFIDPLPVTQEPTDQELYLLRNEIDPQGLIIGKIRK